ncbi:MAG: hypothetical protein DCC65_13415 [Planctomycetota bacterium]|nr:MAG: hypothetical protein DCC65_13415 [Planctomycetota bacterium]
MTASAYISTELTGEVSDRLHVYTPTEQELSVPVGAATDLDRVFAKGLCQQCALAPTCTFPRNWERPILACEEFQGEEKSVALRVVGVLTPSGFSRSQPVHAAVTAGPETKGLCATCEKAPTCTFPGREAGIWQCEEFE